jgi:hypothetical protein
VAVSRWAGPERRSFGGEEEGKHRLETKAGGRRNQSHVREILVVKSGEGVRWAGGTASTVGGSRPMGGAEEVKRQRRGGGEAEA